MRVVLLTDPERREPFLIGDMKPYNRLGRNLCVSTMIAMIRALIFEGENCRFIKGLGAGVYELKSSSRGGHKGGARVYFFVYQGVAVLCRAECKKSDEAVDMAKLGQTAFFAASWKKQPIGE